jgi:hypothetical protein
MESSGASRGDLVTVHSLWLYAHILLFVYWLGADLGVLILARAVKRPDLGFEQRALLLKMALLIDVTPRIAFVLMFPVGFQLATGLGLVDAGRWTLAAVWLLAVAWLALVLAIGRSEGTPRGQRLMQFHLALQGVLAVLFVGIGTSSLLGHGPFEGAWLAAKVLLFGLIFACAIGIDWEFRPIGPAFQRLATEGSGPEVEAAISGSIDGAIRWVLTLYGLLLVIGFLGTTKPF